MFCYCYQLVYIKKFFFFTRSLIVKSLISAGLGAPMIHSHALDWLLAGKIEGITIGARWTKQEKRHTNVFILYFYSYTTIFMKKAGW